MVILEARAEILLIFCLPFGQWDIPCIARVMVRITLSGGVSNVSQRAGWNNF